LPPEGAEKVLVSGALETLGPDEDLAEGPLNLFLSPDPTTDCLAEGASCLTLGIEATPAVERGPILTERCALFRSMDCAPDLAVAAVLPDAAHVRPGLAPVEALSVQFRGVLAIAAGLNETGSTLEKLFVFGSATAFEITFEVPAAAAVLPAHVLPAQSSWR
jgi:hypothetical protein